MDINALVVKAAGKDLSDPSALVDYFEIVRLQESENFTEAHRRNKEIRRLSGKYAVEQGDTRMFELNKRALLFDAPYDFDAYCQYIEWGRATDKRFYIPRRKQLCQVARALQRLADGELELLAVSLPPGVGKALANDTPVLTRNGWRKHGDLRVGDEVIGMDGNFKKVIAVHPKCMLDVLVEFTNGEKIQCHENHEWKIYDRGRRSGHEYIAETKQFEKRKYESGGECGKRGHRYILQLPKREYVVGEHKQLPLDPYLLGVWLGDGSNNNPRICNAEKDRTIIDRIIRSGYVVRWKVKHKTTGVMYYDFNIRRELQQFGMCHSRRRTEKHIPEEYLTSSIGQRLNLLAGLIDTDGTLSGSKYEFTTCDIKLRDTFIDLVSTFGWRVHVSAHEPCTSSSGIKGRKKTYVIAFTPDCGIPCELERKRNIEPHAQRRVAIKSISRVVPKEGNCITVEGDGMYLAGKTMVPTHNTTLALFFLTWLGGRNPEKPILGGSHSNAFLRGAYDECLRILQPDGEYLWHDVFPNVQMVKTNAQDMMIDLGEDKKSGKRFATLEFSSIGSGNAGKVRAENLLYCDDLVDGLESALSRERMDKLWNLYATDLRQRKIGDCRELHIATRWSVHDVIGRLEQAYSDSEKAEFIVVPALDENDQSNFDYGNHAGFTTSFYHQQREVMDDASWRALYMNQPIEREGLLYSEEELRRYFELPDGEPDAVLSVCDTKDRGVDYCVMPIAYQYGNDFYIEDVICDNSNPEIVEARLVSILLKHKVHMSRFESNSAGGKVAEKVQKEVKEKGGRTKITTKYTTQNKETRIIVASPFCKERFLFKDNSAIKGDKEYRRFLTQLCSYTMMGKNKHDDVPDGMAMLAEFVQSLEGNKVSVFRRPF